MIKKSISTTLAFLMIMTVLFVSVNASDPVAKTYSFYSNGMLFRQNDTAVIAGTGKQGSTISVELYDNNGVLVTENESNVSSDGVFEVSFTAPPGSFDSYSVILKENGTEFRKIEDVLFGELWLASGQSNMQYPLIQAKNASENHKNNAEINKFLRVLITPFYAEYNDTIGKIPSHPVKDIPGSKWINANDSDVYGMSAVAYFFGIKMIEELGVPVGILNVSLGGSTIASWISREEIDNNSEVKRDFIKNEKYVELSDWDKEKRSIYYEMSSNYNLRIDALKHFRLSGLIWYQGETDIGWSADEYSRAFDLLQKSYTKLFRYSDGLLPVVFTQLASYYYSESGLELPSRNVDFSEMQQKEYDSRALITIYDVPLTYLPEAGVIHPECKQEVGERMAFAALGLVHNRYDCYTASTVDSTEINDGAIYVKLNNVGDGLVSDGKNLKGFSVCGRDGIYVKADAEIVSNDTVKIYCKEIPSPASAAYAFSLNNEKSNLFASCNGSKALPVSPFVTDRNVGTKYWSEKTWADCDDNFIWHTVDDKNSGIYPSWKSDGASLSLVHSELFDDNPFLEITSDASEFTVSPVLNYYEDDKAHPFNDSNTDYSSYGKMTVSLRNAGEKDVILDEIKFCRNSLIYYSPALTETSSKSYVIPADGEWHTVSFDLNKVYLSGNETGFSYASRRINKVKSIDFCFEQSGEKAVINIDNIRFYPSVGEHGTGFDADRDNAENIFEFLSAVIVNFIGMIFSLFD